MMRRTAFILTLTYASADQPSRPTEQTGMLQKFQRGQMQFEETAAASLTQLDEAHAAFTSDPDQQQRNVFRIEVGGAKHTPWTREVDGKNKTSHIWPEFVMTSRCDDSGVCEDCGNQPGSEHKDCWQGHIGPHGRGMNIFVGTSKWKKHLAKMTIQCAHDVTLGIVLADLVRGNFSVYVNQRLRFRLSRDSLRSSEETLTLVTQTLNVTKLKVEDLISKPFLVDLTRNSNDELHEVVLEYEPGELSETEDDQNGEKPDIFLRSVRFLMDPSFAVCEEKKLCLNSMMPGGTTVTNGSALLRSNLTNQLRCLASGDLGGGALQEACNSWKTCLSTSGTLANMTAVLGASVDTVSSTPASLLSLSTVPSSSASLTSPSTACKMPSGMDPEAWGCSCYESMKKKCVAVEALVDDYTDTLCFQALLCNHDVICPAWKRRNCRAHWKNCTECGEISSGQAATLKSVKKLQGLLRSPAPGLLQKRAFHGRTFAEDAASHEDFAHADRGARLLERSSRNSAVQKDSMFEDSTQNKRCP